MTSKCRIYVGNIPFSADEEMLKEFFAPRSVSNVKICLDKDTQRPRGFAFVEFADETTANEALDMDGEQLGGRTIRVSEARERGESRPAPKSAKPARGRRDRDED